MTRTQFLILNVTVLVTGLLFISEIFLSRQIQADGQKTAALQRIAQDGNGYYARWEKLAVRTYELSLKDPALKEVLTRQQIKITPKTNANTVSSSPAETAPKSSPAPAPKK